MNIHTCTNIIQILIGKRANGSLLDVWIYVFVKPIKYIEIDVNKLYLELDVSKLPSLDNIGDKNPNNHILS